MDKAELRTQMRSALSALPLEEKDQASADISNLISRELARLDKSEVFASFAGTENEPQLWRLHHSTQARILYPRCRPNQQLDFHECERFSSLRKGRYNILEPCPSEHPLFSAKDIPVVLIPGLAFTAAGKRLGQGGGYYDRFLQNHQSTRIGICFDCQIADDIPTEDFDQTVNLVITENRILRISQ